MKNNEQQYNCPFEVTIQLIGGKWKGLILWHLNDKKVLRNGQMLRLIPSITQKMLTQQLREMENDNLIERYIYNQIPPKVEYKLTKYGEDLKNILDMMTLWGTNYVKEHNITINCQNCDN